MLKKVLIRIDYDGVTDIDRWIEVLKMDDLIRTKFHDYHKTMLNNATFDLSRMDEVAEQRSIPISAFQSQPIHRFSQSVFEGHHDTVIMEIANLFTTFLIDCKQYTTIDDYFKYLTEYFSKFLKYDPYIKIKRMGIRKIGGDSFEQLQMIGDTFEGGFFNEHTVDEKARMIEREYHDRFYKTLQVVEDKVNREKSLKVNYSTLCRSIENPKPFQIVLDIDGYIDEFIIQKDQLQFPQDFRKSLDLVNNYLFELYKKSVTKRYLSEHGEEEQQ